MQLFYRTKGDSTRPPLIILHGLWGASDNWLQVAEFLCKEFYVILPDLRNHGCSPHCNRMDYESMSQDISTFIKELKLSQKPMLVGHSMGGKVAMMLLLKEPQLLEKAAILDIAPVDYQVTDDSLHRVLTNFMLHSPLSGYTQREMIHTQIREYFPSEMLRQILFKNIRKEGGVFGWKINIQTISQNLEALLAWPPSQSEQNHTTPILFIRGEESTYITPEIWEATTHIFPKATIQTIPEASHFLHTDQPYRLYQMLSYFFRDDSNSSFTEAEPLL